MNRKKNPVLSEHFERLKELVPEVYNKEHFTSRESKADKLLGLLKSSLGIIEAVYLQNREMFTAARIEEYGRIIHQLKELGYEYRGNDELLERTTSHFLLKAKLPMKKAGASRKADESNNRQAM